MYVKRILIDLPSLVVYAAIAVRVGEPNRGAGAPSTPFASCSGLGTAYPAESQCLPRDIREQLSAGTAIYRTHGIYCSVAVTLWLRQADKDTAQKNPNIIHLSLAYLNSNNPKPCQERTSRYIARLGKGLVDTLFSTEAMADVVDLSLLKSRQRDQLEATFRSWACDVPCNSECPHASALLGQG